MQRQSTHYLTEIWMQSNWLLYIHIVACFLHSCQWHDLKDLNTQNCWWLLLSSSWKNNAQRMSVFTHIKPISSEHFDALIRNMLHTFVRQCAPSSLFICLPFTNLFFHTIFAVRFLACLKYEEYLLEYRCLHFLIIAKSWKQSTVG